MAKFIGREEELKHLKRLMRKSSASFVVIRGRRRIGKSRLINEFSQEFEVYHLFTGLPPSSSTGKRGQITEFCNQLSYNFGISQVTATNWGDAFRHLGKLTTKGSVLLALDELSWIGSKDPDFLGHLKTAWDTHFSQNPKLILIVSGSVSSWLEKNLLNSTGFVGRVSSDIHLKELSLAQASQFWGKRRSQLSSYELFKMLAVTGGVPRYLEEIIPNLPADENIQELCFNQKGLLFSEFDKIFSDLFDQKMPQYAALIQRLADSPKTMQELVEQTGQIRRGTLHDQLHDLVQAGFITQDPTWSLRTMKRSWLVRYRLSDNYLRFYLRYIAPVKHRVFQEVYKPASLPGWDSIMGLQFENLVLSNVTALAPLLGVQKYDILYYGPFFQRKTTRQQGCQVDLLIQLKYHTLFVCEIKFMTSPIGVGVINEVKSRIERLSLPRGVSVRPVLIHVNGVTDGVVQEDYFDHIIDFSQLLDFSKLKLS